MKKTKKELEDEVVSMTRELCDTRRDLHSERNKHKQEAKSMVEVQKNALGALETTLTLQYETRIKNASDRLRILSDELDESVPSEYRLKLKLQMLGASLDKKSFDEFLDDFIGKFTSPIGCCSD